MSEVQSAEQEQEQRFQVFYWRNQRRFRCNRNWESGVPCEFDTYDMATMHEHVRSPHSLTGKEPKVPVKRVSRLVDADGHNLALEEPTVEFEDYTFKDE